MPQDHLGAAREDNPAAALVFRRAQDSIGTQDIIGEQRRGEIGFWTGIGSQVDHSINPPASLLAGRKIGYIQEHCLMPLVRHVHQVKRNPV